MNISRRYQNNFSKIFNQAYSNTDLRIRKAETLLSVINEVTSNNTKKYKLLDIGASSGHIDNYLSDHFSEVTGIDIDKNAVSFAQQNFHRKNLIFQYGDAMQLNFSDESFDIVVCMHIYEHVPDDQLMMDEIFRVLKNNGICYFSSSNRLRLIEPHYRLPFLSVMPRVLAHRYIRLFKKAEYYHEKHRTYWGLKKLVNKFNIVDYTKYIINEPVKYKIDYMLKAGTLKHYFARIICKFTPWLNPGYIWILQKKKITDSS